MLNHQCSLPLNSLHLKSQEWYRTLSGWASTYQLSQSRYFPIDIPIDQSDLDRDPFPKIYYTVMNWKQRLHVMYEDLSVEVIPMTISSWGSNIEERQTTLLYPVWISKSLTEGSLKQFQLNCQRVASIVKQNRMTIMCELTAIYGIWDVSLKMLILKGTQS